MFAVVVARIHLARHVAPKITQQRSLEFRKRAPQQQRVDASDGRAPGESPPTAAPWFSPGPLRPQRGGISPSTRETPVAAETPCKRPRSAACAARQALRHGPHSAQRPVPDWTSDSRSHPALECFFFCCPRSPVAPPRTESHLHTACHYARRVIKRPAPVRASTQLRRTFAQDCRSLYPVASAAIPATKHTPIA